MLKEITIDILLDNLKKKERRMSWDYRVVMTEGEFKLIPWRYWGIHEVYYDENGEPVSCTKTPVSIGSDEGIQEIGLILEMMKHALDKPVLNMKDFLYDRK